ncbi:MAG: hypothetical protein ACMG6E_10695 [Candidatus Roizmanbacteria bacterium]
MIVLGEEEALLLKATRYFKHDDGKEHRAGEVWVK